MKKFLKKTVPAILALLLITFPAAPVLANNDPLPPAAARIAEEKTDSSSEEKTSEEDTQPAGQNSQSDNNQTADQNSQSDNNQTADQNSQSDNNQTTDQNSQSDNNQTTDQNSQSDNNQTADQNTQPDAYYNHVWPTPGDVESKSAIVMENSTSAVLYEKDADATRYPASTTKILTALVAIENSSLDDYITFSENAVNLEAGATNIKAQAGEQMSMRDALYGLLLPSGNDCAVAIAEHVAGSVGAFSEMMNARAEEIGCTGSHFSNPHGLFGEDHYVTARDLALIAQEAFNNSTFVDIISTPVYHAAATNMYDERTFTNTNLLLDEESDYYDPDAIGGKTGYLDEAGRCLVTFGKRDGFTVITVQLNGGYTQIFGDAKHLMDFAFDNFTMQNVSANERRFSYPVPDAKVVLDAAAQILTLKNIPFDQLESTLLFAEDLSVDRRAALQNTTETEDGRTLYALIDYAYDGHELGSAGVYLDPELELLPAAFTSVQYLNPLYLIIFVILVLILLIAFYGARTKKKQTAQKRRPVPQNYNFETYYDEDFLDDEIRRHEVRKKKTTEARRREENYRRSQESQQRNYYYRKRKR